MVSRLSLGPWSAILLVGVMAMARPAAASMARPMMMLRRLNVFIVRPDCKLVLFQLLALLGSAPEVVLG